MYIFIENNTWCPLGQQKQFLINTIINTEILNYSANAKVLSLVLSYTLLLCTHFLLPQLFQLFYRLKGAQVAI